MVQIRSHDGSLYLANHLCGIFVGKVEIHLSVGRERGIDLISRRDDTYNSA